jgi:hypothetical protein
MNLKIVRKKMDWWIIKQLRAHVMSDIRELIEPGSFQDSPRSFQLHPNIPNYQYFSQELNWAKNAASVGKKLFFNPSLDMSARQISASDVLMNLGLLTSAKAMHGMLTQLCDDAINAGKDVGNSNEVRQQLESEHLPVFEENTRGALNQYLLHLTDAEKAPFISLTRSPLPNTVTISDNNVNAPINIGTHHFDVALSFPGEDRQLVEKVTKELDKRIPLNSYFYDNNYVSQLARPNLDILLQDIYRNRSLVVVVFLSESYDKKKWCGVEFRSIREIIFDKEDKVMFVRSDEGDVEGVFRTDGYVDAKRFNPEEIAKFIHERILLAKLRLS